MTDLLKYALLAHRCYAEKPDVGVEDSASRAVYFRDPVDGLIVGFPGSNNAVCWLTDLDALTTSTLFLGKVHAGFWEAYTKIASLLTLERPQVIVGHSLGGALALIYAGALCVLGKPPKAVYAFEPPRVSVDSVLGGVLKAHGVQVVITHNGDDIVPCIPHLDEGWQQPGAVTELCKTDYPYPQISWDAVANIEDHLIRNVIRSIQQLEPQK
jgi:hypothetical protein